MYLAGCRFCDSPTSDAESRAPKGRAKRGRGASSTPVLAGGGVNPLADPSLSPMHSKLRNGAKGRRGGVANTPAPPSPAKEASAALKRKGRPAEELLNGAGAAVSGAVGGAAGIGGGANASHVKRSRSSSRGAGSASPTMGDPPSQPASPVLIECPEPNCSKKYRHINGLKYHQSHAHSTGAGSAAGGMAPPGTPEDEDSNGAIESRKDPSRSG